MKTLLILLLLTLPVMGADSPITVNLSATGPDALRVTGPTEGTVGQEITLVVRGLPEVDLNQKVDEVLALFANMRLSISAPEDKPLDVDSELGFTVAPVSYRLKVIFTPLEPGTHVIAVDWNEPPFGLAQHRVEIRGPPPAVPKPDPDQPTDPTLPPLPKIPTAAVYVFEKDQGTPPPAVSAALHRLNTERESFAASAVDQDIVTGAGQVPEQFRAAIQAAKQSGLPALVVLSGSEVLRVVRDPKTVEAVMEAVQ